MALIGKILLGLLWVLLLPVWWRLYVPVQVEGVSPAVTEVISLAISFAISYAVAYFNRPKFKNAEPPSEFTKQRPGNRGTGIPVVIGRRTVLPVDSWFGNPKAKAQTESVKTKGSKKKKVITGYEFLESGMHTLCCGPANALHAIRRRGEDYWTGNLNPVNHPSGAAVAIDDGSIFRVYWGEYDQPIDPITSFLSVKSRFPGVMYVVWDRLSKGNSEVWPQLEYEITGQSCETNALGSSSMIAEGINPANVLWQVMTGDNGLGVSWELDWIDKTSLEAMAAQYQVEQIGLNLILDGAAGQAFEAVARDTGVLFPESRRLAFSLMRQPGGTPETIDLDRLKQNPRSSRYGAQGRPTRTTYNFPDATRRHESSTVEVSDNYLAGRDGAYIDEQDTIDTATSRGVSTKVAAIRHAYQRQIQQTSVTDILRDGENLQPGDIKILPGLGAARVTETELNLFTGESRVTWGVGMMTSLVVPGDIAEDGTSLQPLLPVPDPLVMVADTSAFSGGPSIVLLRNRAHEQISATSLYASANGGGYSRIRATLPQYAGGEVTSVLPLLPDRFVAGTSYAIDDIVIPTVDYGGGWAGFEYRCIREGSNGAEPDWPNSDGGETPGGGPSNSARWKAQVSAQSFTFNPITSDYRDIEDYSADTAPWRDGEQISLLSSGIPIKTQRIEAKDETAWAASTAYALGDYVKPLSYSTGLRYVCVTAGTTDALESEDLPTMAYRQYEDGTIVWEARYFAQTAKGLLWITDGMTVSTYPSTGDHVLIGQNALAEYIEDARVQYDLETCYKTLPSANGQTVELSTVTPLCLTPVAP